MFPTHRYQSAIHGRSVFVSDDRGQHWSQCAIVDAAYVLAVLTALATVGQS